MLTAYQKTINRPIKLTGVGLHNGLNADSVIAINYIHVLDKPNASFSFNIIDNCETNNLINFLNSSSGAISYVWDFGNVDTSTTIKNTGPK